MNTLASDPNKGVEALGTTQIARPNLDIDPAKQRVSLLLPLEPADVMDTASMNRLQTIGFTPKSEFHVTAFDIKNGSELAENFSRLSTEQQNLIMEELDGAQAQSWRVTLRDEFYILEKTYPGEETPRRSIIQMAGSPDLIGLYDRLNQIASGDIKFDVPPTHVTLGTQGSSRGIGLSTVAELSRFGSPYAFPAISAKSS